MGRAIPVTSWDYVCVWWRSVKLIRGPETVTTASVALLSSQVCRRLEVGGGWRVRGGAGECRASLERR